jgi:hypothetical protein
MEMRDDLKSAAGGGGDDSRWCVRLARTFSAAFFPQAFNEHFHKLKRIWCNHGDFEPRFAGRGKRRQPTVVRWSAIGLM